MRKLLFILLFTSAFCIFSCSKREKIENTEENSPAVSSLTYTSSGGPLPAQQSNSTGNYVEKRIKVKDVGPFRQVFNDSNHVQLEAARKLGIKEITDLSSSYFTNRPIVKITDCEYYQVEELKHSLPFLVPEAASLLQKIGKAFNDSLAARGGANNYIKVTSLLRTPETVGKLRQVNRNATDSSTHQYGTTFDLSYYNFYCPDSTMLVHRGDLKNLLAEILLDFKNKGYCLVKYESNGCFHITALK